VNGVDDVARFAVGAGLAALGAAALLIGAVGALRFADVYERIHAVRAGVMGGPLLLAAFAVWTWDAGVAVRLAFVAAAMALTGPALAHLIAHAAHRGGVEPAARARARAEQAR
jgi:monovalent cation/proton antiporter MnhG/PhaG subunit